MTDPLDLLDLCALVDALGLVVFGLWVWWGSLPPRSPYPRGSLPLAMRRRGKSAKPPPAAKNAPDDPAL